MFVWLWLLQPVFFLIRLFYVDCRRIEFLKWFDSNDMTPSLRGKLDIRRWGVTIASLFLRTWTLRIFVSKNIFFNFFKFSFKLDFCLLCCQKIITLSQPEISSSNELTTVFSGARGVVRTKLNDNRPSTQVDIMLIFFSIIQNRFLVNRLQVRIYIQTTQT